MARLLRAELAWLYGVGKCDHHHAGGGNSAKGAACTPLLREFRLRRELSSREVNDLSDSCLKVVGVVNRLGVCVHITFWKATSCVLDYSS